MGEDKVEGQCAGDFFPFLLAGRRFSRESLLVIKHYESYVLVRHEWVFISFHSMAMWRCCWQVFILVSCIICIFLE